MTKHARMRSTDRDLLVAQKVLSNIRFPDKPELMKVELDKRQARLKERFVDEKYGDGVSKTVPVKHKNRKRVKMYDMRVTFMMKNIPAKQGKYGAQINFLVRNVPGQGMTNAACLQDAKEAFRKYICNGLRKKDSPVQKDYFKQVQITWGKDFPAGDKSEVGQIVAEKFRKWIGKQLFHLDTDIRKKFFDAVKHEEVRNTYICAECRMRKFVEELNLDECTKTRAVCLECCPAVEAPDDDYEQELDEDENCIH